MLPQVRYFCSFAFVYYENEQLGYEYPLIEPFLFDPRVYIKKEESFALHLLTHDLRHQHLKYVFYTQVESFARLGQLLQRGIEVWSIFQRSIHRSRECFNGLRSWYGNTLCKVTYTVLRMASSWWNEIFLNEIYGWSGSINEIYGWSGELLILGPRFQPFFVRSMTWILIIGVTTWRLCTLIRRVCQLEWILPIICRYEYRIRTFL